MLFQNTGLTRAMYQFFQTLIYVAPATLFAVSRMNLHMDMCHINSGI